MNGSETKSNDKPSDSTDSNESKAEGTENNNSSNNAATATTNASVPAALPWEQLQQTMSQFQQQMEQAQSANPQMDAAAAAAAAHVKADISKDNCKMFIGGLNWETTEETLRDYFNKYGHVTDLKIMKDSNTGRSRGFGFLTFEHPSSVDEVVKTQHILDGKVIDPKRSIPREEQDKTGKIFVGGIGADVRPKEFEEFFSQYGNIIDAQLMLDKDTGRSRGFGFVTYDSPDAVDRVCQSKYIEFKGKQIEIKRAQPRHLQKGQYGGANPNNRNIQYQQTGAIGQAPANAMYQNPMMAGFNPMMAGFNPQAMTEYYQKMQEYYQQMQQQTGVDYTQMYQQQMQQMAMMMPGYTMPAGTPGSGNPSDMATPATQSPSRDNDNTTDKDGSNVQTIGGEDINKDSNGSNSASQTPEISLPRGPRDPSSIPPPNHGYSSQPRDRGYRGGNRNRNNDNYRNNSSGGGHRGRGGYNRRNNGYHPYNR
ncbi:hypothetical protein KAFR_0C01680 [Kazachstania africana CBS 2517]|uniref:RRM domain-containing protein n=1 Tax=Kazachstania africana (strain ATCC 22294 / BCRC 22015 / CBS 2517 / CECT 1963 / NBRC 1671 / NRRL Y-8276) TaxID=1071382 RepID=H2AS11_KAZAF|nr:hypothetical protein KAFR_0C01680 [Kazachstania africana CBS 2517]CCF57161.1 hypothetical protein KAFR_0C01680 [Kazachstania africana CBS 2517]